MNYFGYHGEGLKSSGSEIFDEKQIGETLQFPFMRDGEYGSETLQIDILSANIVVAGHSQAPEFCKGCFGILTRDREERILRRSCLRIDKNLPACPDFHPTIPEWGSATKSRTVAECQWLAPRETGLFVHSLLDNGPFARRSHDERMEVNLKTIDYAVVVDLRDEAAGADKLIAIKISCFADLSQLIGSLAGLPAATAAYIQAQFGGPGIQSAPESTHHGGCDSGRVPIHSHHASESLEPERIA